SWPCPADRSRRRDRSPHHAPLVLEVIPMKPRFLPLLAALGLAACATASTASEHSCTHRNAAIETQIGYCQAVRTGDFLYVSGTVGQGEMPAAVRSTYERLRETLEQNGLAFSNVVKENVYTTDLEAFEKTADVRKGFYGANLPAATWV